MSEKKQSESSDKSEPDNPLRGKIQGMLTFQLPEAAELLELAIQAQRWRGVVHDVAMLLFRWRVEAKNADEARAYHSVNMIMRDYLADAGLTLQTHEQLERFEKQRREEHVKFMNISFKKANDTWRDLMKSGVQTEEDGQPADGN